MIHLRELCSSDLPAVNRWRADRDIADNLQGAFRYVNPETDAKWFDSYMQGRDHSVRLGIVLNETEELIGVAYLLEINWVNRSAEYASFIGAKEQWGKGFGTAAERLALEHAFLDLNLHRVFITVLADNAAAIRMDEKNGFIREGVLREAAYKRGEYKDVIVMGMTREDFLSRLH